MRRATRRRCAHTRKTVTPRCTGHRLVGAWAVVEALLEADRRRERPRQSALVVLTAEVTECARRMATPLYKASGPGGHLPVVEALLEAKADVDAPNKVRPRAGCE